jgi:hypothetical protein
LIKTEINPNLAILLDAVDPRNKDEDDDNRLVKVN